MPTAARLHVSVLIVLRILSGLSDGVMIPAAYALIARWSAPKYRSVITTAVFSSPFVGVIVGTLLTGVLCDYTGWPATFYLLGVVGCVWSGAWFILGYSSPAEHPRISAAERQYWMTEIGSSDLTAHPPTPWRKLLTSVPVWALTIASFCADNPTFSIMLCLPLFMYDVLGVNMTENGVLSAVPFVASLIMMPLSGLVADILRAPGRLSTTAARKTILVVGFSLSGSLLILLGHTGCSRALAVTTIFLLMGCNTVAFSTVVVNQLDLAPLHAGKIMGLTFAFGNLGIIAAPHVVSLLTAQGGTRSEWQNVFYLLAAVYAVGGAVFVVFGSGKRQSWADTADDPGVREHSAVISDNERHTDNTKQPSAAEQPDVYQLLQGTSR